MTGDDHGSGGTNGVLRHAAGRWAPPGAGPPPSWIRPSTAGDARGQRPTSTPSTTPDQPWRPPTNWNTYGFEIAVHPLFQADGSCVDFTPGLPERDPHPRGSDLRSGKFPGLPGAARPPAPTASPGATGHSQPRCRTSPTGSGSTPTTTTCPGAWTHEPARAASPGSGHADALRGWHAAR